jgi:transcriptional adapter 2-alpha
MTLTDSIPKEEFQANRKARVAAAKEANERAAAASTGPKQKPTASVPACHEVQGYMPGRLEFETEYANEAEEVVQGMSFEPGDGINPMTGELEPENMLKHDVLAIYNDRLDQRAERKRVVFEHDLLDYRKKIALEKKLPKEERDLVNRCKPFAQLLNKEEYEDFVARQRKVLGLKQAITQLQEWRRMGVTSLEDGEAYEKAKAERAARQAHAQAGQFDRLPNAGRPKPQQVPEQPSLAQTLTAAQLPLKIERTLSGGAPISAKEFLEAHELATALQNANLLPSDIDNAPPPVDSGYRCQPIKDLVPWNMGPDVPDINHLLKEEFSLCNVCHIRPKPYFVIKEGMLKEAMRLGGSMKKKDAKTLLPNLDPQKVSRIYDFFIRAGWIAKA